MVVAVEIATKPSGFARLWQGAQSLAPAMRNVEMCFAPQRRALFRHLTFQKWSGMGVFCTF